jgi:hypothetical protein
MNKQLRQISTELSSIDALCEELRVKLAELQIELEHENITYADSRINVLLGKIGGIEEKTEYARDHLYEAEILADEPREFELFPYPESLAELVEAESALQNLGLNLWGVG